MRNGKMSRRSFLAGSAIGAASLVAATPLAAFADDTVADPEPTITITVENMDGLIVDSYGKNAVRRSTGDVKINSAARSTIDNSDGSYTAVCEATVVPTKNARTVVDNTYDDLGVTIKVSMNYLFRRGQITIQSGSVELTKVAEGALWTSRFLAAAQGTFQSLQQMGEPFEALSHTITTGFTASEYIPTGLNAMNEVNFSGVMSAKDMPEHLVTAMVNV